MKSVKFCLLLSSLLLAGCAVTPKPTQSHAPSWNGNQQDSGITVFEQEGVTISPADRDTFNILVKMFGDDCVPPIKKDDGIIQLPDGNYKMTYETVSKWKLLKTKYQFWRQKQK